MSKVVEKKAKTAKTTKTSKKEVVEETPKVEETTTE